MENIKRNIIAQLQNRRFRGASVNGKFVEISVWNAKKDYFKEN